jgi:hypothetical protein
MFKNLLITIVLVLLTTMGLCAEDTTDISYIMPDNGHFTKETDQWWLSWDNPTTGRLSSSTAYFETQNGESYVVLQCNSTADYTHAAARIGIAPSSEHRREVSNIKKQELIFTITFRGSPSATYGCGTIYGYIQPEINSKYNMSYYDQLRQPGYSPGYNDLVSFKCDSVDTTRSGRGMFSYGTLCVTTTWQVLTRRIIPTNSNYFQFGFIGVKYNANGHTSEFSLKGPKIQTQLQIKEIKLQAIRFY